MNLNSTATRLGLLMMVGCGGAPVVGADRKLSGLETGTLDAEVATGDTWRNYAQDFYGNHCVHCHEKWTAYARVLVKAEKMANMIEDDAMPQDEILAEAEKTRILAWLRHGAPE